MVEAQGGRGGELIPGGASFTAYTPDPLAGTIERMITVNDIQAEILKELKGLRSDVRGLRSLLEPKSVKCSVALQVANGGPDDLIVKHDKLGEPYSIPGSIA